MQTSPLAFYTRQQQVIITSNLDASTAVYNVLSSVGKRSITTDQTVGNQHQNPIFEGGFSGASGDWYSEDKEKSLRNTYNWTAMQDFHIKIITAVILTDTYQKSRYIENNWGNFSSPEIEKGQYSN